MASNRYPAPQRAAFAALATHTGYEAVAAATGVKEHTVREWMRVDMGSRSTWAPTDEKSLKFLDSRPPFGQRPACGQYRPGHRPVRRGAYQQPQGQHVHESAGQRRHFTPST